MRCGWYVGQIDFVCVILCHIYGGIGIGIIVLEKGVPSLYLVQTRLAVTIVTRCVAIDNMGYIPYAVSYGIQIISITESCHFGEFRDRGILNSLKNHGGAIQSWKVKITNQTHRVLHIVDLVALSVQCWNSIGICVCDCSTEYHIMNIVTIYYSKVENVPCRIDGERMKRWRCTGQHEVSHMIVLAICYHFWRTWNTTDNTIGAHLALYGSVTLNLGVSSIGENDRYY